MAGFFFISLIVSQKLAILLFAFLSFLALKEYFTLIQTRLEDHRVLLWAYLAIPIQYWWIYSGWKAMFLIFVPVYMFLLTPLRMLLVGRPKGMVEAMSKIHWGLMSFVFCISHVAALLMLGKNPSIPGGGESLLVFLVFLTEINDVAQYLWGKLFGKRKIAPNISPKKTWAGLLGGVFTTVMLAIALRFLSGFNLPLSITAGLLIGISGFVGDLVLSAVKRDVGVKDSSNLIPGHGGILDRIDSLTYTAPLFFHFVSYFFYHAPIGCAIK
jgi:phosphatidate cytidylyltransferase